jgi:hypothetical protein
MITMKTSEVLKLARPLLRRENENTDDPASDCLFICEAVSDLAYRNKISLDDKEQAKYLILEEMQLINPLSINYSSDNLTLFRALRLSEQGIVGTTDPAYWPIRDAWLDALIAKLEAAND